jgi:predicted N-acetyltransferase YhbS
MTKRPGELWKEDIGNGLVLHCLRDAQDIERFVSFNTAINGSAEGKTCDILLRAHPETRPEEFLIVEDRNSGAVVSSSCLIPWHCRYEDIPLNVAMIEMVTTHPEYRHRGLVRLQMQKLGQLIDRRGTDLVIIEGIPYFYRQFGYSYAIDHRSFDLLPVVRVPNHPDPAQSRYELRPALSGDAAELSRLYTRSVEPLQFAVVRDEAYWRFLLESARFPTSLLVDRSTRKAHGYLVCEGEATGQFTAVFESGAVDLSAAWALLRELRSRGRAEARLFWPQEQLLLRLARSLGSTPAAAYQWLLRIPNVPALLQKIAPVLQRRLARCACARLTTDLTINLLQGAYVLRLQDGKLSGVHSAGFVDSSMGADPGDLCIPPDAFVRLLFGYRSLGELRDAWPDIVAKPQSLYLVEGLFPKMTSYLSTAYHYHGS